MKRSLTAISKDKNVLYCCIKLSFSRLKEKEKMQKELNIDNTESQKFEKYILNSLIKDYIKLGGKRNIDKFLEYYIQEGL